MQLGYPEGPVSALLRYGMLLAFSVALASYSATVTLVSLGKSV